MSLFTRTDPVLAAARAEAQTIEARAKAERVQILADSQRGQVEAARAAVVQARLQSEEDARLQAAAKWQRDQEDRARREARTAENRTRRAARRAEVFAKVREIAARGKLIVPLLVVNGAAVYGQVAYAYEHIAPVTWPLVPRLLLAAGVSVAVESVAVYVGWHAHDALLQKATATAARLRRASYLIAALVALVNYAHFAGEHLTPTPAAAVFGLLSLLSPWLWGLHTRREQHVQLAKEGVVDCVGATFSAERRRAFPIRTAMARRWSIDHNVTDPARAWAGYNAERVGRLSARTASTGRLSTVGRVLIKGTPAPAIPSPRVLELSADDSRDVPALPAAPAAEEQVDEYTAHAAHDGTPREDCSYCPSPEIPVAPELAGLSKAAVVLRAVRELGGDPDGSYEAAAKFAVPAIEWAAQRGVVIEAKYPYDVLKRHQRRLTAARGAHTDSADLTAAA